jgi:predicted kinase
VPRLIHLNGPPGVGKTTLALHYAQDHPLSLCVDIDVVRSLIGGWSENPRESGQLARRIALDMACAHLSNGHDVVVPQLVARTAFVEALAVVAEESGSSFHEVLLWGEEAIIEKRFERRAGDPAHSASHAEKARMLDSAGGYASTYGELWEAIGELPGVFVIDTTRDREEDSYRCLLAALDRAR